MPEPTRQEILQTNAILKQAYASGVLAPPAALRDPLWFDFPRLRPEFVKALSRENETPQRIDRLTDQIDEPGRDTRRINYQESSWYWDDTNRPGPWQLNGAYEIARFIAAPDEVGIVKYIGTFAGIGPNEGGFTQLDPHDPFTMQRNGLNGYWLLRLYQNTFRNMPPPDAGIPAALVAGYPFPELARWDDYRFQWGRTANETFFIVPSNHALRLYFVPVSIDGTILLLEVLGRLVGFTQPIDTLPAAKNVFYAW